MSTTKRNPEHSTYVPTRGAVRQDFQKPPRITKDEAQKVRNSAGIYENAKAIVEAARKRGII